MQQFNESAFQDFLSPGISPRDVDALFPLLQSANVIQALIALFRGGGEEVRYVLQCCVKLLRVLTRQSGRRNS